MTNNRRSLFHEGARNKRKRQKMV